MIYNTDLAHNLKKILSHAPGLKLNNLFFCSSRIVDLLYMNTLGYGNDSLSVF